MLCITPQYANGWLIKYEIQKVLSAEPNRILVPDGNLRRNNVNDLELDLSII